MCKKAFVSVYMEKKTFLIHFCVLDSCECYCGVQKVNLLWVDGAFYSNGRVMVVEHVNKPLK